MACENVRQGVVSGEHEASICECSSWIRLDNVHRNLPGAIWTAAQEVCLKRSLKPASPHVESRPQPSLGLWG